MMILQWVIDGSDITVGNATFALKNMPLSTLNSRALAGNYHSTKSTFEVRLFYNPERHSAINIGPWLVGIILIIAIVHFTSAALMYEREPVIWNH